MLNGKISAEKFLKQYWQRKPVLLPQALPAFKDFISPEALAGMACEEDIESRIVTTQKNEYSLRTGPFLETDFTSLPETNWTLLVQAVDQWLPQLKTLLQKVDFIPNWRIDDVMVSFATAGGGVGPHFDFYDVFLVQGQGSRVWKLGQQCSEEDVVVSASGLKLLQNFTTEQEVTLNTGDVLYVPPSVAHWGLSNDDSLCYSIGFRAPSVSEMLLDFSAALADTLSADQRYTDPSLQAKAPAGEINTQAFNKARKLLLNSLQDEDLFKQWFGSAMTEPRYPELINPNKRLPTKLDNIAAFQLNPASRLAWHQQDKQVLVFLDGSCIAYPDSSSLKTLLQALSVPGNVIASKAFTKNKYTRELLEHMYLNGALERA